MREKNIKWIMGGWLEGEDAGMGRKIGIQEREGFGGSPAMMECNMNLKQQIMDRC